MSLVKRSMLYSLRHTQYTKNKLNSNQDAFWKPDGLTPAFWKSAAPLIVEPIIRILTRHLVLIRFWLLGSVHEQFGFQLRHSRVMATLKVVDDIKRLWQRKKTCVSLFIHLTKAFDYVDHPLLIHTLISIGIVSWRIKWRQKVT